mmetsp:Transcript_2027/g.2306  ORF Transcript_2027/g.2306 Transcript_2027/m.2306 type:complete len:95 (+) Transcript_2027:218-502(+)
MIFPSIRHQIELNSRSSFSEGLSPADNSNNNNPRQQRLSFSGASVLTDFSAGTEIIDNNNRRRTPSSSSGGSILPEFSATAMEPINNNNNHHRR